AFVELVTETSVQRPGQIPLRASAGITATTRYDVCVVEVRDRVPRGTNTCTDIGNDAVEVAEVGVDAGEQQPLGFLGAVLVGHHVGRIGDLGDAVKRAERGLTAIFRSEFAAQPVVDLVADAGTEQRRRAEAALVRPGLLPARSIEVLVVESLEVLVGHAEVAAQIPAADG